VQSSLVGIVLLQRDAILLWPMQSTVFIHSRKIVCHRVSFLFISADFLWLLVVDITRTPRFF
jgi:hypothetical protein